MSYASNLLEEGIDSQYLAIISPKKKVDSGWVLDAGSVYKQQFTLGYVSAVSWENAVLTAGTSSSLLAGQFYYDQDTQYLYIRLNDSSNPNGKFVIFFFDFYCSTFDKHWHRLPTDANTTQVYWEPVIAKSPSLKITTDDVLFGFLPVQTSSITLNNPDHYWEEVIYDCSFNRSPIKIWHQLGDLQTDNLKLVYDGFMNDVEYNGTTITIKCYDKQDLFNTDWRNPAGDSFFSVATFPSLDPNFVNRAIRYVYGKVDGFTPVNIQYKNNGYVGTDNRNWVAMSGQTGLMNLTKTVGGGTHTTTRTYVTSAVGLYVGDSVWLDRVAGVDEYVHITGVNYVSNYIDHAAIASPMANGDSVKRGFIGNITIVQKETVFKPHYGRDYTTQTFAGTTSGFSFDPLMESTLTMPEFLSPNDRVFCRVYGRSNDVTLGGPSFGGNDSETGNLTNPVVILVDLLKKLGITDSQINQSSFTSIVSSSNYPISMAIPFGVRDNFPSYKDLLIGIMQTILARVYSDTDNKWKVTVVAPLTTYDKSIDDTEILKDSLTYEFDYGEILSDIFIEYDKRENADDIKLNQTSSFVNKTSDTARYLHSINRQKTFQSLNFKAADAQKLCDRLSYIFGDRIGRVRLGCKNRFFDMLLSDKLQIDRSKLPGFSYNEDVTNQRKFSIIESDKSLRQVSLLCDDQKGIQDNQGSW